MSLAIGLATRGRSQLLASTLISTLPNLRLPDTRLLVSLDEDDTASIKVVTDMAKDNPKLVPHITPRPDTIAEKWNHVLTLDADLYMPLCDDGPTVTPGFDAMMVEAAKVFPDGIGVVLNHLENLSFTGIQVLTKRLTQILGYVYPPYFPYWFVDHWVDDLAKMTDRWCFVDVWHDTSVRPPTQEMREPPFWADFYDACLPMRYEEAERILAQMDEPEWRKDMIRSRWPLIDQRSVFINNNVRTTLTMQGPPPDERYLRVKSAAVERMKLLVPLWDTEEREAA